MGWLPSRSAELPLILPNRDMIGCGGHELSPFPLEITRSDTAILSLIGSMYDSVRTGCYDWKLRHALIVGQEVITQTFWCWDMDIDMFNCQRWGGSELCCPFSALPDFVLDCCNKGLAGSPVTNIHPPGLTWPVTVAAPWLATGSPNNCRTAVGEEGTLLGLCSHRCSTSSPFRFPGVACPSAVSLQTIREAGWCPLYVGTHTTRLFPSPHPLLSSVRVRVHGPSS